MAQLAEDKEKEDTLFPEDSNLNESQRSEYEKCLKYLRNNENDMENAHRKVMSEMKQMTETEMDEQNLIKDEDVDKIIVKHAYCSECGEELISNAPPMFNPFTFERICKHTCTKCGTIFNLEHAYPRFAFINNKGEEIPAFGR
jgi:rRNA maturation protein Nop10